MQEKRFGDRLLLRLDSGEEAVSQIRERLQEEGAGFAFLSAAGGVRRVKLGYWNAGTKKYEHSSFQEQLEVLVLQGNCSQKDDEAFLHLHAVFGREDFSTIGGHVVEAEVHPTLEVWVRMESEQVTRTKDASTGLEVLRAS